MLTKDKSGLSRVSKIPRRLKLGIHTIILCLPPFPALRIRPLAFVIMITFIILSLDFIY